MTNWTTVRNNAVAAAENQLEGVWAAVGRGVTAQVGAFVQNAQYIADHKSNFSQEQIDFLWDQYQMSLKTGLLIHEMIGIAAAVNTVNAIVTVILTAAPGLLKV